MLSRSLSRVGVIGRPNVGKSTLFNKLTRTRKALVKEIPERRALIQQLEWPLIHKVAHATKSALLS